MTQYTFKLQTSDGAITIEQPRGSCHTLRETQTKKTPLFENVTLNGTTKLQRLNWEKIAFDISGSGRLKPYFNKLSVLSTYKYFSFNPLDLYFNGLDVPQGTYTCKWAIRTDQDEYRAYIHGSTADGRTIYATIDSIDNKVITFTFAETVVDCNIVYYPIYPVRILPFSEPSYDISTGEITWNLNMETV